MKIVRRAFVLGGLAAALVSVGPAPAAPDSTEWKSNWFRSPTGNIRCRYWGGDRLVACTTLNNGRMTGVTVLGNPFVRDSFGYSFPSGPVLTYGDTWSVRGRFKCWSRSSGMTCRSLATGAGFFIAREGYRLYYG